MKRAIRKIAYVSGAFAITFTAAVLTRRVREEPPIVCASGATRATTPCAPGPTDAVLAETCVAGAWVASSCDVPLDDADLCFAPAGLPALDLADAIVVSTGTHTSWNQVLTELGNGTKHQILLQPGNYESWGAFVAGPTARSGTAEAPIVFRYYGTDDDEHPIDRRDAATEAVIHGVHFWGDTHDWIVHGVTIRDPDPLVTGGMLHLQNGDRITFDRNLIEDAATQIGIRIRDGSDNCVQRNVVRTNTGTIDGAGIQIKPDQDSVARLRIVQNEVYNWIDAIQTTNEDTCFDDVTGLECTVSLEIVGNDLYTTSAEYVSEELAAWAGTTAYVVGDQRSNASRSYVCITAGTSAGSGGPTTTAADITDGTVRWRYMSEDTTVTRGCNENALDFKAPTSATMLVARNRMWGYRETPLTAALCGAGFASGSAGDAIVIHIDATNVQFVENIIGESVSILRQSFIAGGRSITFRSNYAYNVPDAGAGARFYGGAAFVVEGGETIADNLFANVTRFCPVSAFPWPTGNGWSPGAPVIFGNTVLGDTFELGACSSDQIRRPSDAINLRYTRKRYSGAEQVTVTDGYR